MTSLLILLSSIAQLHASRASDATHPAVVLDVNASQIRAYDPLYVRVTVTDRDRKPVEFAETLTAGPVEQLSRIERQLTESNLKRTLQWGIALREAIAAKDKASKEAAQAKLDRIRDQLDP